MSGICGIVKLDGNSVKKEEIEEMLAAMQTRGNDAKGVWIDGNVGFGHKMLWTTPESLYENQPHIHKDGSLIITADARIDNRNELFEKLGINENEFDIITDIDLLLWSYQKWGMKCPEFIRGDFVFAIWDINNKELFCARDRIGLKPFNYFFSDDYLIFSSEIDPIFKILNMQKKENLNAIRTYIHHWSIPHGETFYKDIKRLPSSTYLLLSLEYKNFKIHRYWFPEKININTLISFEDAAKKFSFLFKQAVESNMRSAYPIAFEVSGGLDSSSVLCIGDTIDSKQEIVPYTLHYENLPCDEIEYIEIIENEKNIKILKINVNQFDYKNIYKLNYVFKYSSAWPMGGPWVEHLAKNSILAKKNVRVILSGIGGDEVLPATNEYFKDYKQEKKYWKIFKEVKCMEYSLWVKFKIIISVLFPTFKKIIKSFVSKKELLNHDEEPKLEQVFHHDTSLFTHYQYENAMSVLSTEVSYWADMSPTQLSGKENIEYRHPFYDTRLIEFLFSLPPEYRNKCGIYKSILRKSMRNILPDKILNRKDKAHFWTNLRRQMKEWNLDDPFEDSMLVEKCLLKKKDINLLLTKQDNPYNVILLWIYINLNRWYNESFKR